jgi:5'-methylthioadenosine phosphorylase
MKIGIIGGGEIFDNSEYHTIILEGNAKEEKKIKVNRPGNNIIVYSMPRHGFNGHSIASELVNYKENISIFSELKVEMLIGVTAVGSLNPEIKIGDIVIPNQMIDLTKNRNNTFNTLNSFQHVSMKEPFSPKIRSTLSKNFDNAVVHFNKTVVTIEGPQFSTVAESRYYRSIGADIINMTTSTEAKLAREKAIEYQPLALVSDMDIETEDLSFERIVDTIKNNSETTIKDYIFAWLEYLNNIEEEKEKKNELKKL